MPARIGSPKAIQGITNLNGLTRYSTAVGLLMYKEKQLKEMPHRRTSDNPLIIYLIKGLG